MSLIVILFAIFIERISKFIHPLRNHFWLIRYAEKMIKTAWDNGYAGLLLAVLPIVAVVTALDLLFDSFAHGLLGHVFDLIIVLYCLGDSRLREHIEECYKYAKNGQDQESRQALDEHFGVKTDQPLDVALFVRAFYQGALQRLFSILFWFVLLGPAACMAYRLTQRLSLALGESDAQRFAMWITFVLDWLPARLLALSFCLAGHFSDIFSEWCNSFRSRISETYHILYRCGHAAIRMDENPSPEIVAAQFDEAYALVNRSLFIWLVILALVLIF
jgi:AmpE protein